MSNNRLKDIFKAANLVPAEDYKQEYGPETGRPIVSDDKLMAFAGKSQIRMIKMSAIALTCQELGVKSPPALCQQSKTGLPHEELHDGVQIDCNDGHCFRIVFVSDEVDSFVFREDPADSKDVTAFMNTYVDKIFMLQKLIYGPDFEQQVQDSGEPAVNFERLDIATGKIVDSLGMSTAEVRKAALDAQKAAEGDNPSK